ncbi:MAG: LysR family transcriptional regulator [Polyangiaceae bacterium]
MADGRMGAMNLNLLAALDALLAEGSVTRAAQRMGVTQSAMSHSLRQLRELLGDPLLVRGPLGMTPTPRGEALREPVRRGLLELSRALAGRAFEPEKATRTFTISAGDFFTVLLLPPLLSILQREAPGIDVSVRPAAGARDADLMEAGEIDAAVAVVLPERATLRRTRLFTEGFACVVREGHPEVGEALSLEAYVRLPHALISPGGSGPSFVDEALARLGKSRRIALRVPYFLAAPPIIARSDLLLTAPRRMVEPFAGSLPLRLLEPPLETPSFSVHLAWHERDDADPAHQWLRRAIGRAADAATGRAE